MLALGRTHRQMGLCLGTSLLAHLVAWQFLLVDGAASIGVAREFSVLYQPAAETFAARRAEDAPASIARSPRAAAGASIASRAASAAEAETDAAGESDVLSGAELGIEAAYPRLSRLHNESGQVLVGVRKTAADDAVIVHTSSGFARLDEAALSATRSALTRGLLDSRLRDRSDLQITFDFKLVHRH